MLKDQEIANGAEEPAPAKVNLFLHILGKRADGYHLLESLVVFAAAADTLSLTQAETLSLQVAGPFAQALDDSENLVLRAVKAWGERSGIIPNAALKLVKNLPVAAGLGGGSADAAAALRLLARRYAPLAKAELFKVALSLGADVPVCLRSRPARISGVGEHVAEAPKLPTFGLVLANPGIKLATASVFRAHSLPPSEPVRLPPFWLNARKMAEDLRPLRNDLEQAACALCPPIAEVLAAIAATEGCLLARMSGSGPTCFGLYERAEQAKRAAELLPKSWWRWGGASFSWGEQEE
ncbi:MAG: 4-(cytidine 5'-diphospho)-2-C-methyl-D-erythritol kinase [Acidobacteriia bacterium]|nr:4-(cytidine 5'-diphospho)-2-C-methyl-D-erythritol kinase [Methyloceanibacter sp.]MCL6490226.1 4-(cytidine 5'-diphospho)-2-C-methyl-D-erythritol kinase [Terriglobia bacterium]